MRLKTVVGSGALFAALLGGMSAQLSAQQDDAGLTSRAIPKALVDAGEYGENLYDAAKANDWASARKRLRALQGVVKQVSVEAGTPGTAEDRLQRSLAALNRAVARRQRRATMEQANQITLNVTDMTTGYASKVPVQVTRLDFYGRELEIWSDPWEPSRLKTAAEGMRREWDVVRPSVQERSQAEAKKFGTLVTRVERAKTSTEYLRLAEPVLDEVDNLEKVFER